MVDEVWKDVLHYEGLYLVSNYGRVKNAITGKFKTQSDNGHGYLKVILYKNNKGKNEYVHRLVALAFIPNPENKTTVNHLDEDKQNNYVGNLEWATQSENNSWGTRGYRQGQTLLNNRKTSYRVNQYDMDGNYLATYRSMREAERINGISNSGLYQMFSNNYSQCGGYLWSLVK